MMENVIVPDFFNKLDDFFVWVTLDDRKKLEEFYGSYLPQEAWVLLSLKDKSIGTKGNPEGMIVLSINEIISISDTMDVDFLEQQLVPLVCCMDADYLVYDLPKKIYSMYNVVDESSYEDYQSLNDFVQKKYKHYMKIKDK